MKSHGPYPTLYMMHYATASRSKKVIHCNPMTLPLRAKEYISHDPRDASFGALPFTKTALPDASLALPAYKAEHFTTAL